MVYLFNIKINKYGNINLSEKTYFKTLFQFFMKTPNNLDEMIDIVKSQLDICDDIEQEYFYFDKEFHYFFSEKNKSVIRQFYYDFLDECNEINQGSVLGIGMYYFMPIDEEDIVDLINNDSHINNNNNNITEDRIIQTHVNKYNKIISILHKKNHKYILYLTNCTTRMNLCTYYRRRGGKYSKDSIILENQYNYTEYISQYSPQ